MSKHDPKVGDDAYDPSKDPLFMEQVKPSPPVPKPPKPDTGEPKVYYGGTKYTAQELVDMNGTNPDGSPRTEAAPDGPVCPPVGASDGPFDTTTIPMGCSTPLTAECADHYNKLYGFPAAK
jgi:hypothetical protein